MRILISHSVAAAVVSVGCLFAAPTVLAQQQVPAAPHATAAIPLGLANAAHAQTDTGAGQGLGIARAGTQPSSKGPAANFTGSVRVDPLFQAKAPARTSGAYVTFEPGARSAWHSHPMGQTLVVTAGVGRVQQWGEPVQELRPGDVVWTPPGVKHWHGAAPATAMTHMAIQESAERKAVEWMERVSDAEYGKTPR
jgi:quercetin dioxygenase-like cupin family protein